ncbi:hypothetical protein HK098_000136 [Nowakowskiella sp. JEL0407]|nr:hypothetical protein HK098_000136 [Nowakowskiella sp. JEL0407]
MGKPSYEELEENYERNGYCDKKSSRKEIESENCVYWRRRNSSWFHCSIPRPNIFQRFCRSTKVTNFSDDILNLDLEAVSKDELSRVWNKVKSIQLNANGSNEKAYAHPYLKTVFRRMIKELDALKVELRLYHGPVSCPTWFDYLIIVEADGAQDRENVHDDFSHERRPRHFFRFSLYTNANEIRIFVLQNGNPRHRHMSSLMKFTAGLAPDQGSAPGFTLLYRIMKTGASDFIKQYARIRDEKLMVKSLIYKTPSAIVGIVEYKSRDVIAKFTKSPNASYVEKAIKKGIRFLRMLEESGVDDIAVPLTDADSKTCCVLFEEIGETLSTFSEKVLHRDPSPENEKKFIRIIRDLVEILFKLHTHPKL